MRISVVGQILPAAPAVQRELPELRSGPQVGALNAAGEAATRTDAHVCAAQYPGLNQQIRCKGSGEENTSPWGDFASSISTICAPDDLPVAR